MATNIIQEIYVFQYHAKKNQAGGLIKKSRMFLLSSFPVYRTLIQEIMNIILIVIKIVCYEILLLCE